MNEKEKKRAYNERILQINHGTFTPVVVWEESANGLAQLIFEKRDLSQSISSN